MRLAPPIHRLITFRSLKSRLLLGLSCALAILAGAVLGMAWQVGKIMVHETNIAHLRYEADLLADEITHQINQRINALGRERRLTRQLKGLKADILGELIALEVALL